MTALSFNPTLPTVTKLSDKTSSSKGESSKGESPVKAAKRLHSTNHSIDEVRHPTSAETKTVTERISDFRENQNLITPRSPLNPVPSPSPLSGRTSRGGFSPTLFPKGE